MPKPNWNKHYCAGKGDHRRPEDVERFRRNFDRIFRKAEPEKTCGTCRYWDWISDWCGYPDPYQSQETPESKAPPCGGELWEEKTE